MPWSIPSLLIPLNSDICRAFFHFSFLSVGHLPKKASRGWGIVKNNSVFRTLKVAYGSIKTCVNISTCEREMIESETCTVNEKGAVLAVIKRFDLLPWSYKNTLISKRLLFSCSEGRSFALFRKPHSLAFERVSWPRRGAFATISKAGQMPVGRGAGWADLELIAP